jgi:hypothetical protein
MDSPEISDTIDKLVIHHKSLPPAGIEKAVNALFDAMTDELARGGRIEVRGFDATPSILSALTAVESRLRDGGISHALIGGLALGAHNVVRATEDVDFLIDGAREPDVNHFMVDLGFETLQRGESVSNYLLQHQRVDFVHARRKHSQVMLRRAPLVALLRLQLPVATVEDLIALKLQDRHSDPSREQDTTDIHRLVEYNIETLDVEYLREFFKLFKCEAELDELVRHFGRGSR